METRIQNRGKKTNACCQNEHNHVTVYWIGDKRRIMCECCGSVWLESDYAKKQNYAMN